MKRQWRKLLAGASVFALTASLLPTGLTVSAAGSEAGTPYTAEGTYDVTVPHVIVNQVYGGSDDGAASHSFIELYNQTAEDVDLTGWRLAYRSSEDGDDNGQWSYFELTGVIRAKGYYLVRCGATSGTDYTVPAGDQEWDIRLHNKGVSVALLDEHAEDLTDAFAGAIGCSDSRGKTTPVVHVCNTVGNNRYFMYYLRAMAYGNILMDLSNGVRIRSSDYRNFDRLGVFGIAIPPRDEQDEIAEYLDRKCAQIEQLIAIKQAKIEKLEQYKRSLIYEYVTGKREVM